MQSIRVHAFGGPEVLQLVQDVPIPVVTSGTVLVRMHAAGVNPVDTFMRSGVFEDMQHLPYTPGEDGSGVVEAVGENITSFAEGDRVWFWKTLTGSYAEYSLCEEQHVFHLPPNLTSLQGAMIGVPYLTSFRALVQKAGVVRGETVLVHGATGGVGTAAVQVCRILGTHVIGTAGSTGGQQLLREMGVEEILNHHDDNYVENIKTRGLKIDVILETMANVNLQKDLEMIGHRGRIVVIGGKSGILAVNPLLTLNTECCVMGCALALTTPEEYSEQITFLQTNLPRGILKPVLWKTYSLENADKAHLDMIENSGTQGQIVLTINLILD